MSFHISINSHPTTVYVTASVLIALCTLNGTPSLLLTTLLLTILRTLVNVVYERVNARYKIIGATVVLAFFSTLASATISASALGHNTHTFTAVFALFAFQLALSSFVISTIVADVKLRKFKIYTWIEILLFPSLWTTQVLISSTLSPLGRIGVWSPLTDTSYYSWILSVLGPLGIDWIVGAWATVVSDVLMIWIHGLGSGEETRLDEEPRLIDYDHPQTQISRQRSSKGALPLTVFLLILATPSHFLPSLPLPLDSEHTVPFSVACALPYPSENAPPSFDHYLHETQVLLSHAKVVLWPEGAVRFETEDAKYEAVKKLTQIAQASVIGMSFEDAIPLNNSNPIQRGLSSNGLMLIDKNGVVLEYYERHLVPFVDTDSMVSSRNKPTIYEYPLIVGRNSRNKVSDILPIPISASICLDFAFNSPFSNLKQRPTLILGSARTWHEKFGAAMWAQAKSRAEEIGSALLWCDGGENGVSGAMGLSRGIGEVVQVGAGSWATTFALKIPLGKSRTMYGTFGDFLMVILICFLGLSIDKILMWKREEGGYPMRIKKCINACIRAWAVLSRLRRKRGEQQPVHGELEESDEHSRLF